MARIILSEMLNDIRASVGAHTYSVWRGIHYVRGKAASVANPNSTVQENVRNTVAVYSVRWTSVLTDAQRYGWNEYAQTLGSAAKSEASQGFKNIMPLRRKVMSGYNAYISVNISLLRLGMSGVDDAPLGEDALAPATGLTVTPDGPPTTQWVVTWTDPAGITANDYVVLWVKSSKYAHPQLLAGAAGAVQTVTITNVRGANGANIGLPDDFYSFQLQTFGANGLVSAGSNIVTLNKTA